MQIANMNSVLRLANVTAVYKNKGKLIVQVTKKLPLSELKAKDVVPRYKDGLRTDVIERGVIKAFQRFRPLMGGISCVESNLGSGTLGGIVRDSLDGALVALTCNHCAGTLFDINYVWPVYGNTAISHINMRQPSYNDGGTTDADNIGNPKRAIATQFGDEGENYVDAAIITLAAGLMKTDIRNISRGPFEFLSSSLEYAPGTTAYKMGRTTELTQGTIISNEVAARVNSNGDYADYYNQMMVESLTPFLQPGDSGSLILVQSAGIWKIIGLLFAGNEDGTQGFANHIGQIATDLQIEAWDGNIVSETEYPFIMAGGRCYQYVGTTIKTLTHPMQRNFSTCADCKAQVYPKKKLQVIS